MTFRRATFASILFWPLALSGADRATVKADATKVYSHQRASAEEVVTTLKRGDAVSVDLTFSSAEGNWCEVTAPGGIRGFMRSADLEREPAGAKATFTYVPNTPPSPAGGKPSAAASAVASPAQPAPRSLAQVAGDEYLRPIQHWMRAFGFTADQQAAVAKLAGRAGVTVCRDRIEAHIREYEPELTDPAGAPPRQRLEQMARDFNQFAHPCMMKQLELLESLPSMMTPGQQADKQLLASFKKDLARQRQILTSPDTYPGIAMPR